MQDPQNIQQRTIREFDFLRNNLSFESGSKDDNEINQFLNLTDLGKNIVTQAKGQELKRKREEAEQEIQKSEETEQIRKKVRADIDSDKGISIKEWVEYA